MTIKELPVKKRLFLYILYFIVGVIEIAWIIFICALTIWMYPVIILCEGDAPEWLLNLFYFWIDPLDDQIYEFTKRIVDKTSLS